MSISIELSDQQAAALRAKAAARGLTLSDLFDEIVRREADAPASEEPFLTGYGMLAKYGPAPSAEEIDENRREMFQNFAKGE
jgi:hypothetical protein